MTDTGKVLTNGVKLVGEALLPGASLLLDGRVGNGVLHAVVGLGARMALGPIGFVLVAADSYSKSVTNKYLWEHLPESIRAKAVHTRAELEPKEPAVAQQVGE